MGRLNPARLHVRFMLGTPLLGGNQKLQLPRRYTLTHSDTTGELYLTVGPDYDAVQISGWYTRLMRDEVLAEWQETDGQPVLHVFCHVSGGLTFGPARWRYDILQHELPLVLEALRFGDRALFEARSELDGAPILVHFAARQEQYRRTEAWGVPADYRPPA